MNVLTSLRRPGVALLVALSSLVTACVGAPSDPPGAAPVADDTRRIAPLAQRDGTSTIEHIDLAPTPGASRVICDDLPDLSDARNLSADGTEYQLGDLFAAPNRQRTACASYEYNRGGDLALRFTSPVAATWRLQVDGGPDWQSWNLSVLDGCSTVSEIARCRPYARTLTVTLAAGQNVTLVIDNLPSDTRFKVRAVRINTPSAAPEVRSARAYTWGRGALFAIDANDPDADLAAVFIELRDVDGQLVPIGALPRYELDWGPRGRESVLELSDVSERAARARIWAEDATGRKSAVQDVRFEPRPTVAIGQRCDSLPPETACEFSALCIYDRSTGRLCRARLIAHHDPRAGSLRVDLNDAELNMAAAEVALLDDAGNTLERSARFPWSSTSSVHSTSRAELFAREGWSAPPGLARVRVTAFDRGGRRVTDLEAPLESPESRGVFHPCDPATTARVRCADGLVCVAVPGNSDYRTCQVRDPACPAAWDGPRWEPRADTTSAVFTGRAQTSYWTAPACLQEYTWTGQPIFEDVIDFVAPVAGTYRFRVTNSEARGRDFSLAAYRHECRLDRAAREVACGRSEYRTDTAGSESVTEITASAGERFVLRVTTRVAAMDYRAEVSFGRTP